PHDLFHVHSPQCTWQITVEGDESSERVTVSIENRMRLLPLFDAAGAFAGIADGQGCIYVRVAQSSTVQPAWARSGSAGANPSEWVNAR
ncbi:MAG: pilus assembly protein, partial [Eggerthellaceae bacterium]|nr:pilus assembly protein [Eggerthellaceae bacterium]